MNTTADFQRRCSDMVQREVIACMSGLVSTLAQNYDVGTSATADLKSLCEEAFELSFPVQDWEEAALQEGWTGPHTDGGQHYYKDTTDGQTWACGSWEELCREFDIEPYDREVFEHWAVSNWLADKLTERGERVLDFDNFKVWARCTSGQAISIDGVIESIVADMLKELV